uniref:Uncharacterized protein n=1 Tax=Amphiprion percula TaxID=161767 RepID=A0A3P8TGP0_AMPPE
MVYLYFTADTPVLVLKQALWRCNHTRETLSSPQDRRKRTQHCCLAQRGHLTLKVKMPETAEAVSATLTTNRNCTIEITNVSGSYCLINPKVYMSSGFCQHPPQPTVRPTKTEVCSFTKDGNTATGAVGLLTYDLFHMQSRVCSDRMAIMFSVPFDHNLYKNRLSVGVVETSRACDKHLYDQLYDGKDLSNFARSETSGGGLEYQATYVDLRATMSSIGKAIVKMELYDKMGR